MNFESSQLFPILQEETEFHENFRQLGLKEENSFNWYCKGLGVDAWHGEDGEVASSWRQGWLRADRVLLIDTSVRFRERKNTSENLDQHSLMSPWEPTTLRRHREFHPFRVFVVQQLNQIFDLHIAKRALTSEWFRSDGAASASMRIEEHLKSENFAQSVEMLNGVVDLAILLEPLFWPEMVGISRGNALIRALDNVEPYADQLKAYRDRINKMYSTFDEAEIQLVHTRMRRVSEQLDGNSELYLMLRATNWGQREKLKGNLGLALWIRHIAELIRRGAAEFKGMELPSEDGWAGTWHEGARKRLYGDENPIRDLDAIRKLRNKLLPRWGLHSAPRVQIYVEGDTEAGIVRASIEWFLGTEINLVNLKSVGWGDRMQRDLQNDVDSSRFSIIIFDGDVDDTVRCIKSYAKDDLIVGMVFVQTPDVEFENFTIAQLLETVEKYETEVYGEQVREFESLNSEDFQNCSNGKEFEETYKRLRPAPGLKGELWGKCLARTLWEYYTEDTSSLLKAIICSIRAIDVDYEVQRETYRVNPESLLNEETEFREFNEENS